METLIFLLLLGWSDEIYITQDTVRMEYPIAVPYLTDSILCIWREEIRWDTILVKGSFFNGSDWTVPEQLSPDSLSCPAMWYGRPGLTVDSSNNIWISWYYGSHPIKQNTAKYWNWGIYTRTYDGIEWGTPAFAETAGVFELNMCTAKDGRVFISWEENIYPPVSIYLGWYEETFWSKPVVIAQGEGDWTDQLSYFHPCLSADTSNSIFIAYYKSRYDGGTPYPDTVIIDQFKGDGVVNIGYKDKGNNWNPVIDVDCYNRLWLVWVSDRDGDTNVYNSYYQNGVWSEDIEVTADSFADLEPAIVCHKNGVPWITWTSRKDYSIWTAYYVGGDWHSERVSKENSSHNSNPYIIEGPQGKLWVFWQKSKGDTNSICCSWRELVGAEEPTPYTLTPKPQLKVYPNPFTSKTVIRYSLPVDYTIHDSRLTIHDISGRLIQTFHLTNDQSQVIWYTKELPGGVYFLHLNMGDIKKVKKLTLIR